MVLALTMVSMVMGTRQRDEGADMSGRHGGDEIQIIRTIPPHSDWAEATLSLKKWQIDNGFAVKNEKREKRRSEDIEIGMSTMQRMPSDISICEDGWPAAAVIPDGDRPGGPTANVAYLVFLKNSIPYGDHKARMSHCTASWIADDLLITAAHCIYDRDNDASWFEPKFYCETGQNSYVELYVGTGQTHESDSDVTFARIIDSFMFEAYGARGVGDMALLRTSKSRKASMEGRFGWRPRYIRRPRFIVGYPAKGGNLDGFSKVMDYIEGDWRREQTLFAGWYSSQGGQSGSPIIYSSAERVESAPRYSFSAIHVASSLTSCTKYSTGLGDPFSLDRLLESINVTVENREGLHWIPVTN